MTISLEELARRIGERPAPAGFEDTLAVLSRRCEQLATPINFPALVAAGQLRRLSSTRYRALVPLHDLPDHVTAQVVEVDGDVLTFERRSLREPTAGPATP
jgi:hypothetical protein